MNTSILLPQGKQLSNIFSNRFGSLDAKTFQKTPLSKREKIMPIYLLFSTISVFPDTHWLVGVRLILLILFSSAKLSLEEIEIIFAASKTKNIKKCEMLTVVGIVIIIIFLFKNLLRKKRIYPRLFNFSRNEKEVWTGKPIC